MTVAFQIRGLDPSIFADLRNLTELQLAARGVVIEHDGGPCRVTLEDAPAGTELLLFTYRHQDTESPYRAEGPIYIRRDAELAKLGAGEVPGSVRTRMLSVRAYNNQDMIVNAEVTDGSQLENVVDSLFMDASVAYLHVHYARYGCYACRVDRA